MRNGAVQDQLIVCRRDYVLVQVDLSNRLFVGRWLREPKSFQFKTVIALAALALVRYKVDKVLINSQKKMPLTLDEQTWFQSKAQALLDRRLLKKVAYVHSSDIFQQIIGEDISRKLTGPENSFMIQTFHAEEEALEWLLS